jgi:muconolactone delta-isomerase
MSQRRTESFTDAEFAAYLEAEIQQAQVLYAEGFIRQIWHRKDVAGACILVEADSEEQVREKLNTLPLMQKGMLAVSITPLQPYAGFCPR